jgi:hypothetical protein
MSLGLQVLGELVIRLKSIRKEFPAAELVQFAQLLQERLELPVTNTEAITDRALHALNQQLPDLRFTFPGVVTGLVTALCPARTKQLSSEKEKTQMNLMIKDSRLSTGIIRAW